MDRLAALRRRLRRTILARRRLLAALCAAAAVAVGFQAASEPPLPKTSVLIAAHDIAGGVVISASDLTAVGFDPASVPTGVVTSARQAVGRTTAAPLRAGEPITDVRLLSGSLLRSYPGMVAAPLRIGDAAAVELLRVGDEVDVLAADPQGASAAAVVAADVPVIALPTSSGDQGPTAGAMTSGGLLVVAVSPQTAAALAGAGVSSYLSIVINR